MYGAAGTSQKRNLPSEYDDGKSYKRFNTFDKGIWYYLTFLLL